MKNSRFSLALPSLLLPFLVGITGCSAPVEDKPSEPAKNPWNGQTYLLDIQAQDWAEPRGIGTEIDAFVPNFLFRVEGDTPETFNVVMGTADANGAQDSCNMTSMLGATAQPPGVTIGPSEFPLHIQHVDEPIAVDGMIYDLTLTNVLPNGDAMSEEGELLATMDFRELYPLFTLLINPTPETVCSAFEDSYEPCAPCPTDGQPFCLTVRAISLGAAPSGGPIEPIDGVDPSCTPVAAP